MNGWTILGIAVVIAALLFLLITQPFSWQHKNEMQLRHDNDSLKLAVQGWKNSTNQALLELAICQSREQVNTDTTIPSGTNDEALTLINQALNEENLNLKELYKNELAKKLQKQEWGDDKVGYTLDNKFITLKLFASGTYFPLKGIMEVNYTPTWMEFKETATDTIIVEKPVYVSESYFSVGGGTAFVFGTGTFEPFLNVGANLDIGSFVLDFKAIEPRYSLDRKRVEVASRAELKYKL